MKVQVKVINYPNDKDGIKQLTIDIFTEGKVKEYFDILKPVEKELEGFTITAEIDTESALTTFSIEPNLDDYFLRLRVLQILAPTQIN